MRYFTGTTSECLESILENGAIAIKPPHRVWKDFSEDYVYLIPFDEKHEENRLEAFDFAAEQSSFAIHALNHSTRIVLEIEDLDEAYLDDDPDGVGIGAVRHSMDIPLRSIVAIHTETNGDADRIKEFIAITHFTRLKHDKKFNHVDFDCLFDEEEFEENRDYIFNQIAITHLELIDPFLFIDDDAMQNRYQDLYEEVEYSAIFSMTVVSDYKQSSAIA